MTVLKHRLNQQNKENKSHLDDCPVSKWPKIRLSLKEKPNIKIHNHNLLEGSVLQVMNLTELTKQKL